MALIYIVSLSEVTILMMLNKLDFRASLNLHHLKLKNTGYSVYVRHCLRFARVMTIVTVVNSFFSLIT